MNVPRTLALVLGGVAAGGAVLFGVKRLREPEPPRRSRTRSSSRPRNAQTLLVRVTENGKKYHRDSCPLLHGETRVITVAEAMEHYEPCKACHPPGGLENIDEGFRVVGLSSSSTNGSAAGAAAATPDDASRPAQ